MFWTVFTIAACIATAVLVAYLCIRILESKRVRRGWGRRRIRVPGGPKFPVVTRHWFGRFFYWKNEWVDKD
ncbi:MAG: hypothetical protein C4536_06560 [Actinobacteria bacterium]|nr:MAG: hypothetical protein C4536_06560 [Actinomycetota bacterium]